MFYSVCREVDHSSAQCALAVVQLWVFTPAGMQGHRSHKSDNICLHGIRGAVLFRGHACFGTCAAFAFGDHKMISSPSADRRGVSSRAVGVTLSSRS